MSYTRLLYHIIFRFKDTASIPIENERLLYKYVWGFVENKGAVLYRVGGMPDHIHVFVQLPATIAVADFVRDLKVSTAKFLKEHHEDFPHFNGWGRSYCALSYSENDKDKVVNYIRNQKEHHKKVSPRDELLALLRESNVEVDMRYFMKDWET